jgi:hypothetical protein
MLGGSVLTVVVLAVCLAAVVPFCSGARWLLFSGGRCSDAKARFSERLAGDPMLRTTPPGVTATMYDDHYQPCDGDGSGDFHGGATVAWAYPPAGIDPVALDTFYRDLGQANGWRMRTRSGALSGSKVIDGTSVRFTLRQRDKLNGQPVYWVKLEYD